MKPPVPPENRQHLCLPHGRGPGEVLGVLLHEMIHAALPMGVHHGPKFAKACKQIGLEGKPTHATPGPKLKAELARLRRLPGHLSARTLWW
jgi:hypothetical protein